MECAGVCADLLGGSGPTALVFRGTYPRKALPAVWGGGVRAFVSHLGSKCWCLCCLVKLDYTEGMEKEMAPANSFVLGERSSCLVLSGKPSQKSE